MWTPLGCLWGVGGHWIARVAADKTTHLPTSFFSRRFPNGASNTSRVAWHVVSLLLASAALLAKNADDAARSLATGVRQPPPPANTICEGLKTALGEIPWAIIKEHVRSIEVVDDDQVLHAWRAVLREARIIIEPACAVPVAAALTGVFAKLGYQRVALILTGGNIDLDRIPEFLERTA